jgi:hypothetical protein
MNIEEHADIFNLMIQRYDQNNNITTKLQFSSQKLQKLFRN